MTEENKELLIAKLIDTPSLLTKEELDIILGDEELMDIYELSAALANSTITEKDYNMREEWELFHSKTARKQRRLFKVIRIAAIFIGVVIFSGLAILLSYNSLNDGNPSSKIAGRIENKAPEVVRTSENFSEIVANNIDITQPQENNIEPPKSYQKLGTKKAELFNDNLILEEETDEEEMITDEYLRLQQARIDNDVAMQTAGIYKDEYESLLLLLKDERIEDVKLVSGINQITIP